MVRYSWTRPSIAKDLMAKEDLEHTFTEDQVQELIDWIESLTLIDIAALKSYWEKRPECEDILQ